MEEKEREYTFDKENGKLRITGLEEKEREYKFDKDNGKLRITGFRSIVFLFCFFYLFIYLFIFVVVLNACDNIAHGVNTRSRHLIAVG